MLLAPGRHCGKDGRGMLQACPVIVWTGSSSLAEEGTAEGIGQVCLISDSQKDGIRMQGLKLCNSWHLPLCAGKNTFYVARMSSGKEKQFFI